jgi:hypothetical protein
MKSYTDHDLKIFLDPLPEKCIKFMQDNFNISSAHELTAETADDLVFELRSISDRNQYERTKDLTDEEYEKDNMASDKMTEYDIFIDEMLGYINFKLDDDGSYNPDIQILLNPNPEEE